jgi:hypothetical protein
MVFCPYLKSAIETHEKIIGGQVEGWSEGK